MGIIITYLLLFWVPFGRAHQIYVLHLKNFKVKQWPGIAWNHRFTILESGVLGYFTPWLHKRWDKTRPKRIIMTGNKAAA